MFFNRVFKDPERFLEFVYLDRHVRSGIVYKDKHGYLYSVDPRDNSMVTNLGWLSHGEAIEEFIDNSDYYLPISVCRDKKAVLSNGSFSILMKGRSKSLGG